MSNAKIEQVGESPMFAVTVSGSFRVRPDDVARMFCALDAHQQAGVIALIATIAGEWTENGAQKQWLHVAQAMHTFGPGGAETLRSILAFYDEPRR